MAAGTVAEETVESLEKVVDTVNRLDGFTAKSLLVGAGIGIAVGFFVGYRYGKKKLRAEVFAEAEREMDEVREHYRQKTIALESREKPSVDEVIRDRGYSTHVDIVDEGRLHPPFPVDPPRPFTYPPHVDASKRVYRSDSAEKDKMEDWDYEVELSRRTETDPYIIHQDEFTLNESGFTQTVYTYYAGDDILVEENDPETILHNRENLIGEEALNRFGHGSDDYNLVHVRNPYLELEMEIGRVSGQWVVEVQGLNDDETD